jgi:zinc ribbon protein
MARFCGRCGAPIDEPSAFCTACGAPVPHPLPTTAPFEDVPQAAYAPSQPYSPPAPAYTSPPPAARSVPPRTKGGSAMKILLVVLVVLALGALGVIGTLLYYGHKVVTKIEDKAAQAGLSRNAITGKSPNTYTGDPCRFLTTAEVSKAIGVPITGTKSDGSTCEYMAHGTAANMTSKHLSAMVGRRGADRATQEKFQRLAEGIFGAQQKNAESADPNEAIETTVLSVSIDQGSAEAQMKLDSKVLGALGPASGSSKIAGIGDEAFVAADGMILVRKGDTLVRITYISCPCNTEQIEPLAKRLVAAL